MGEKSRSGSGMNIQDHILESLETIFWVKVHKFLDEDPGSWNLFDPGSGRENSDIGSATLVASPADPFSLPMLYGLAP
jgi:hypothetical protein